MERILTKIWCGVNTKVETLLLKSVRDGESLISFVSFVNTPYTSILREEYRKERKCKLNMLEERREKEEWKQLESLLVDIRSGLDPSYFLKKNENLLKDGRMI
jgi:hypothetical protein